MDDGKLLSIIIPAYNVEDYIGHCLASILSGMSEEAVNLTEIIVVNDGSTDGTMDVINNYVASCDLVSVIDKINGGLSSARNAGLRAACGKYVFFVDSDDYLTVGAVDKLINFLSDCSADIVDFDGCRDADNLVITGIRNMQAVGMHGKGQEIWTTQQQQSCFDVMVWLRCFMRKLIISNELYFYEGIIHEDEEWMPRVYSYAGNVAYLNEYIYVYRRRGGSITTSHKKHKNFADIIKICDSLLKFSKMPHLSCEFQKTLLSVVSDMYYGVIRGLKRDGEYDACLIDEIAKRQFLLQYSPDLHRKYIYRYFILLFGLRAFYLLKYKNRG